MKVLVVGCGSVGKRHIRNLIQLKAGEIHAVDSRRDRLEEVKSLGIETCFTSIQEALRDNWKPHAAVIATPPKFHITLALDLLDEGCDILIEKPLSRDLEGVNELIEKARRLNRWIMTGYTYRFWNPLIFMKRLLDEGKIGRPLSARISFNEYLPDWHPWEDYRKFYMASKDLGGGALLDSSHTLDIARWFFGEVKALCGTYRQLSNLEIETDDFVEIFLEFNSGTFCSVRMDLIDRAHQRDMSVAGEDGNLNWDFAKNQVNLYDAKTKKWECFTFKDDRNDMFISEMSYFLNCVQGRQKPNYDFDECKRTMELVALCRESQREGKWLQNTFLNPVKV